MPGTFASQYAESIKLLHVSFMTFLTSFVLIFLALSKDYYSHQWSLEIAMFNAIVYSTILHIHRAPFIAELFALLLNNHYLHNETITELFMLGIVILLISGISLIILCVADFVQKRRNTPVLGNANAYHGWFDLRTQPVLFQVLIVVLENGYMIVCQWISVKENIALSSVLGFVLLILPLFVCCCFYVTLGVISLREDAMNATRIIQPEPSA